MPSRSDLHRRFAARRPGTTVYRLEQEAGFIEKNNAGLPASPLFFRRGQSYLRQASMAASSRWLARRCGFCCVNPRACNKRPTWSGWYSTPNRRWITFAIRRQVHKFVRKPATNGPARTMAANSRFCTDVRRDGRPRFGLAASACRPPCTNARFQRFTLDKSASTSRATSVRLIPSSRRSTARWRRASSAAAVPFGLIPRYTNASEM